MSALGQKRTWAADYFSLSLLFYQREIPKKSQNNNSMTSCLFGSGTPKPTQHCALPAPDFPLALALRGADAMWTALFSVTFVIAVALQLAALSQVD